MKREYKRQIVRLTFGAVVVARYFYLGPLEVCTSNLGIGKKESNLLIFKINA